MKDPKQSPAYYPYCLTDVDGKDYADTLDAVFRDPNFVKRMESRTKLYQSLDRMPNKNQVAMSFKQIEKMDQVIGGMILQALVMRSLQVNHCVEHQFNELLKDVDLTDEKNKKANDRLAVNLDTVTFLADVLESKLVDISSDLNTLFNGEVEFKQFDGVQAALRNMVTFFNQTRNGGTEEEQNLFCEYADSIEQYINKRMTTFIRKYRALKEANAKKK